MILSKKYANLSKSFSSDLASIYLKKITNMSKISVVRNGVRMHRAAAELLRLKEESPYMAALIEEFIYEKADQYVAEVKLLYDEVLDFFESQYYEYGIYEKSVSLMESLQAIVSALVPLSALSMDAYLLSRMFLQTESTEIIAYAGSNHIKHYSEFFEDYLAVKRLVGIEPEFDNRCMNVVDLPKYLDANKYRKYVVNKKYGSFLEFHKRA